MIRTTALGSIYLLLLLAVAAGASALSGGACSDWLASCPAGAAETWPPNADDDGASRRLGLDQAGHVIEYTLNNNSN